MTIHDYIELALIDIRCLPDGKAKCWYVTPRGLVKPWEGIATDQRHALIGRYTKEVSAEQFEEDALCAWHELTHVRAA